MDFDSSIKSTKQAMRGGVTFFEALEKRLDLIQPTVRMMDDYLKTHPPRFTPGIK
jgi:phosphoserine phosphatase